MILFLRKSPIGARIFLSALSLFSFVSFATAIYNPEFHEKLHSHGCELQETGKEAGEINWVSGLHDGKTHRHSESGKHHSGTSCDFCNVQSHIAANLSNIFILKSETALLPQLITQKHKSFCLSNSLNLALGRAPPFFF